MHFILFPLQRDADFIEARWTAVKQYLIDYQVDMKGVIRELSALQLLMVFEQTEDGSVVSALEQYFEECAPYGGTFSGRPLRVQWIELDIFEDCFDWLSSNCNYDMVHLYTVGIKLLPSEMPQHFQSTYNGSGCWVPATCLSAKLVKYPWTYHHAFEVGCPFFDLSRIESKFGELKSQVPPLDPAFENKTQNYMTKYGECPTLLHEISDYLDLMQKTMTAAVDLVEELFYLRYKRLLRKTKRISKRHKKIFSMEDRLYDIGQEVDIVCSWIPTVRQISQQTTDRMKQTLMNIQTTYNTINFKLEELTETHMSVVLLILEKLKPLPVLMTQYMNNSIRKTDLVQPITKLSGSAADLFSNTHENEAKINSILNDISTIKNLYFNYKDFLDLDVSILTEYNVQELNIVQAATTTTDPLMKECLKVENTFNCLYNGTFTIYLANKLQETIQEAFKTNITEKIHLIDEHFGLLKQNLMDFKSAYQVDKTFQW